MNCTHASWKQMGSTGSGFYVSVCTACGTKALGMVVVSDADVLAARLALGFEVAPC